MATVLPPATFDAWMRAMESRVTNVERRPQGSSLADFVDGGGGGSTASGGGPAAAISYAAMPPPGSAQLNYGSGGIVVGNSPIDNSTYGDTSCWQWNGQYGVQIMVEGWYQVAVWSQVDALNDGDMVRIEVIVYGPEPNTYEGDAEGYAIAAVTGAGPGQSSAYPTVTTQVFYAAVYTVIEMAVSTVNVGTIDSVIEPDSTGIALVRFDGGGGGDGAPGPPGPAGPAGVGVPPGGTTGQVLTKTSSADYDTQWQAAGTPVLAYRHVQSTAATTWTINHNLSFRPNVAMVDSLGNEGIPGRVAYTSDTQVVLTFSASVAGEAYLS